jgi:hypothetical protein
VFEKLHDIGSRNTTTLRKTLDVDLLFRPHDVLQWQEEKHFALISEMYPWQAADLHFSQTASVYVTNYLHPEVVV